MGSEKRSAKKKKKRNILTTFISQTQYKNVKGIQQRFQTPRKWKLVMFIK